MSVMAVTEPHLESRSWHWRVALGGVAIGLVLLAGGFGLLALTGPRAVSADSRSPFESELARLAGRAAQHCGLVTLHHDYESATGWRCAMEAERKGQSFWFAVEGHGEDSEVWSAVIRTPSGEHVILDYDSNANGGRGLNPRFYRNSCPAIVEYLPNETPPFRCKRV